MRTIQLQGIMQHPSRPGRSVRPFVVAMLVLAGSPGATEAAAAPGAGQEDSVAEEAEAEDVVRLAAYNVKADRIEDFGFRVSEPIIVFVAFVPRPEAPYITAVLPNTAAAKAGLQPGDRILKSDGRSAAMTAFSASKWAKLMRAKNAEAASGKKTVTWTLEIESRGTTSGEGAGRADGRLHRQKPRTVTLSLPTPPPHWGAAVWRAPEGRPPSVIVETGPLAEQARAVLDHGIWAALDEPFASVIAGPAAPFSHTGYEWSVGGGREGLHRIVVTQAGGRTRVFLDMSSGATGRRVYLTSPSGVLEKAWRFTRRQKGEISLEEARVGFAHELDLWTTKVGKFSARWPFEVRPGYDANAVFAVLAAQAGTPAADVVRPVAAEFLQLPAATEAQQGLFADAYGKLGADQDCWAYTETSRGLEDQRVTVTRVDPSKPEAERCVLLSLNGKVPTAAEVQAWRDAGGEVPRVLGDFPALASLVELKDLRVYRDEPAAVVFEAALRTDSAQFPSEKFQALFRVNKTRRAFEDITIRMREAMRVAGVVKITEAGLQARFQALDPAYPPQPVFLRGGGAARVLGFRIARDFETTRADFRRVQEEEDPSTKIQAPEKQP